MGNVKSQHKQRTSVCVRFISQLRSLYIQITLFLFFAFTPLILFLFLFDIGQILPMIALELPVLLAMPKSLYLSLFYTSVMYFLYNTVSFNIHSSSSPILFYSFFDSAFLFWRVSLQSHMRSLIVARDFSLWWLA